MLSPSVILLLTGAEPGDREGARSDAGSQGRKKAVFLAPSADMETFRGFCFSSFAGELPLFETCRSLLSCKQGFAAGMGRSCRCQHPCPGGMARLGTHRRVLLYFGTQKTEFPEGLSQQRQVTGKLPSRWEG